MRTVNHPQGNHEIPVVILNTGVRLSALGFDCELPKSVEDMKNAVLMAVQLGCRHFDTSPIHGTQEAIGLGLAEAFKVGLVKREEVFVTSKVLVSDAAEILPSVKKSLRDLQLDYLDLCLLHSLHKLQRGSTFPPKELALLPAETKDSWQALERCLDDGLTKAIGVSNFIMKELKGLLLHAKVVPAVVQVELHPMWQQNQLVEYCRSLGIRVCASHPLASGPVSVTENPILKDIAAKLGKTPSQVALRWIIENGIVPVLTSYSSDQLSEYMNIFNFKLSADDNERIATIEQRRPGLWNVGDISS